jgi:hypothetical protein
MHSMSNLMLKGTLARSVTNRRGYLYELPSSLSLTLLLPRLVLESQVIQLLS